MRQVTSATTSGLITVPGSQPESGLSGTVSSVDPSGHNLSRGSVSRIASKNAASIAAECRPLVLETNESRVGSTLNPPPHA
ncbi:unnamed protein product [Protopolystoma xenopodis]|uniref:Uncharacterized protein n=1 Tax=Protopolystoma xenopodis TaxID=117903 RepID=A0A3S5CNK7_9PLAT|nr:unnamed protein product [Protopolystoma xenopodis]